MILDYLGHQRKLLPALYNLAHEGALPERFFLVGVSRTSKTPLSIYLGYLGYKTANVPLVKGIEPPRELFNIDPAKLKDAPGQNRNSREWIGTGRLRIAAIETDTRPHHVEHIVLAEHDTSR